MISKFFGNKSALLSATFVLWAAVFAFQKPVFLLLYHGGLADVGDVVSHGLPIDLSLSGYFSAITALLLLCSCLPFMRLHEGRGARVFLLLHRGWVVVASLLVALSFVSNLALYGYWRFPLDSTPLFFLTSSPADALASAEWWQLVAGLLAMVAVVAAVCGLFFLLLSRFSPAIHARSSWKGSLLLLILTAALFLPIRGGVTVASMNTGRAYFSTDQTLNHAAVNPLFSFMESVTHSDNFAEQYRYMDNTTAHRLSEQMLCQESPALNSSKHVSFLNTTRPDIYLLILESFSDTVTHALAATAHGDGTLPVTPHLNSLKQEGVWFSRFYANSFRTDRGLVATLLGYPSPATMSLMKYPRKTASIPSLPDHLGKAGYGLHYYYGGDADFTNMRSFLIGQGFSDIVEDVDFPIGDRLSKWGVPDHLVFHRVESDLRSSASDNKPMLRVIQTSSSHEPFDVPFHRLADKRLNAFAYTDSCVGAFVQRLKDMKRWDNALVILVPDHMGAWPEDADPYAPWRYHIPMIWTGGAIREPRQVSSPGAQQDLAATLLGQLGIAHDDMLFSKDMFNPFAPHFAFFMMNDGFGLVNSQNMLVYDNKQARIVVSRGNDIQQWLQIGQSYVQRIYDDIAAR